jgi:hypothetical protein
MTMIVYMKTAEPQPRHRLIVTPGKTSDCSDFWEDGKPKIVTVTFFHGSVEVPDNLGRWLIDHGYARATRQRIIIPEGARL